MPELWDQLTQQPVAESPSLWPQGDRAPLRITVGGPTMKDGAQASSGSSFDPFNPPQVEYVGRPIVEGLAKIFSGPSWLERATEQSARDQAAFQAGGVPGLMADTTGGQELAGGFGGTTKGVGIRAYHGSPHDFERFDLSKIGTGEGAQAYGHGLYFAGNEKVARQYKEMLGTPGDYVDVKSKYQDARIPINGPQANIFGSHADFVAAKFIAKNDGNIDRAIADIKNSVNANGPAELALQRWKDHGAQVSVGNANPGKMYEVNINADPAHMLDWDKPLAKQPIYEAVRKVSPNELPNMPDVATGKQVYEALQNRAMSRLPPGERQMPRAYQPLASETLRDAGIPGIKYLDQGSRNVTPLIGGQDPTHLQRIVGTEYPAFWSGKKSVDDAIAQAREMGRTPHVNELVKMKEAGITHPQTSNYVMFNDKLIDIIRKYGLAGALFGGGGAAASPNLWPQEARQ